MCHLAGIVTFVISTIVDESLLGSGLSVQYISTIVSCVHGVPFYDLSAILKQQSLVGRPVVDGARYNEVNNSTIQKMNWK